MSVVLKKVNVSPRWKRILFWLILHLVYFLLFLVGFVYLASN